MQNSKEVCASFDIKLQISDNQKHYKPFYTRTIGKTGEIMQKKETVADKNDFGIPIISEGRNLYGIKLVNSVEMNADRHSESVLIQCPYCKATSRTRIVYKNGRHTFFASVMLSILCLCLGLIPYFYEKCQDVQHYCSKCQAKVGIKKFKICS